MKYCNICGSLVSIKIPQGDQKPRHVCDACNTVHYQNPKIIVGCLPVYKDQVLLCRRGIEPRKGFWTLPAGFLELGESIEQGAIRETYEEAGAQVVIEKMYTLFNMLEVHLFNKAEIPWNDMAFKTSKQTLKYFFEERENNNFQLHMLDF